MGGVVDTIKSVVSNPGKAIGQGIGDVLTLGTDRIKGSPTQLLGKGLGAIGTGGLSLAGGGGGGSMSAPTVAGQQSPLDTLSQNGGAPLLMDIALGADVGTSLMSYFGASGDYNKWFSSLSSSDQQSIQGLHDQLTQVQTNTATQNNAVKQLTNDYPNIMTAKIQQYSDVADPAIQGMMKQAIDQISAKQAAGGMISSGASALAAAQAGTAYAGEKLNYATGMAQNDFNQQLSAASALQTFQQKMLGQGASQGFNAVQNQLQRNTSIDLAQAGYQNDANKANVGASNAMYGALGSVAGTVAGGIFGGPIGATIGGNLGNIFGGGSQAPRLNTNLNSPGNSASGSGTSGTSGPYGPSANFG